ncbi:hypothetical protein H9Q72_013557 [Fusarium xylarioides]|uniref:Uncharacterized protein n=1 Tax=Fusarium xylarioides TaxID=221167 RepID=A0A9P7HLV7_9HYPO|nr:hypothetical protein H9Q72_013557 [Fusarium xylarioides]
MPSSNIHDPNGPGDKSLVPPEDAGTGGHNSTDIGPDEDHQTQGSNVPPTTEGDPISPSANEPFIEQAPDRPGESPNEQENGNEGTKEQNTDRDSSSLDSGSDAKVSGDEEIKWTELIIEADDDFESLIDKSPSQLEWLRQKRDGNEKNEHIMSMVGHENVKAHFMAVKHKVDDAKRSNKILNDCSFDLVLHSNDGTGEFMFTENLEPPADMKL